MDHPTSLLLLPLPSNQTTTTNVPSTNTTATRNTSSKTTTTVIVANSPLDDIDIIQLIVAYIGPKQYRFVAAIHPLFQTVCTLVHSPAVTQLVQERPSSTYRMSKWHNFVGRIIVPPMSEW